MRAGCLRRIHRLWLLLALCTGRVWGASTTTEYAVDTSVALWTGVIALGLLVGIMACVVPGFLPWRHIFAQADPPVPRRSSLTRNASQQALQHTPSRTTPYYAGLVNPNIYCFFNSVVQSLGSVHHLAMYLDEVVNMSDRWDVDTPVSDTLRSMLVALNTPQAKSQALVPRDLQRALRSVPQSHGLYSLVSAQQQQDAHELAVLLIHALDAELGRIQHTRAKRLQEGSQGLAALVGPSHVQRGLPRTRLGQHGDHVTNIFHGTMAQRTACAECGYMEAVRFFAMSELDLVVPPTSSTLEQCLAAWTQLEQIDWTCHGCTLRATQQRVVAEKARCDALPPSKRTAKQRQTLDAQLAQIRAALQGAWHEADMDPTIPWTRAQSSCATKQVMLASPPPVLVIHLNRSSFSLGAFGASKNHARVHFPDRLNVAPFMVGSTLSAAAIRPLSTPDTTPVWYQLVAVVTHYGSHNYGHYVCFRKRPQGKWTRISDETVQVCTLDDVLAQNPYLLLYERMTSTDPTKPPTPCCARTCQRWDVTTVPDYQSFTNQAS